MSRLRALLVLADRSAHYHFQASSDATLKGPCAEVRGPGQRQRFRPKSGVAAVLKALLGKAPHTPRAWLESVQSIAAKAFPAGAEIPEPDASAQPLSLVKVDRSFVQDVPGEGELLIKATVDVARCFGLEVVAEGVETQAQRTRPVALGVNYMQGYLFGRPMPHAEFIAWMCLRDSSEEPFALQG